jgi:hypothetical protein
MAFLRVLPAGPTNGRPCLSWVCPAPRPQWLSDWRGCHWRRWSRFDRGTRSNDPRECPPFLGAERGCEHLGEDFGKPPCHRHGADLLAMRRRRPLQSAGSAADSPGYGSSANCGRHGRVVRRKDAAAILDRRRSWWTSHGVTTWHLRPEMGHFRLAFDAGRLRRCTASAVSHSWSSVADTKARKPAATSSVAGPIGT